LFSYVLYALYHLQILTWDHLWGFLAAFLLHSWRNIYNLIKISYTKIVSAISETRREVDAFVQFKVPHFFNRLWLWNGFICELHNPVAFKISLVYLGSVPIGVKIRDSIDPLIANYLCKPEDVKSQFCDNLERALHHLDLPFTWTIGFYASICLVLSFVLT
jgi:hypothetical protein